MSRMVEPRSLDALRVDQDWVAPDRIYGVLRAKAADRRFRLRRLVVPASSRRDFVDFCKASVARPDLALPDVTARTEGRWLVDFHRATALLDDATPPDMLTTSMHGAPIAIAVPVSLSGISVVFWFDVTDSLTAKSGRDWLSLFAGVESVSETHLASTREREWQIDQSLLAIYVDSDPPTVLTEIRGDEPSSLARLFQELDPAARTESGRLVAAQAISDLATVDQGLVSFSARTAAALSARASSNLQFSTRLEQALTFGRWRRLTKDRILEVLSEADRTRWGIGPGEIREVDGHVELDVSEASALRILKDAFARSLLNNDDMIDGEGRPAERPEIIQV